jgi:hypothetical protein
MIMPRVSLAAQRPDPSVPGACLSVVMLANV